MPYGPLDALREIQVTPLRAAAIAAGTALLLAGAIYLRHRPPAPEDAARQPLTTTLALDGPLVASLGALDGPYRVAQPAGATALVLEGPQGRRTVRLAGLRDAPYPDPAAGTAPETPADRERQAALSEYLTQALGRELTGRTVYLQALSSDAEPLVYLYRPLSEPAASQPPRGAAHLVQAELLRRGVALMEVEGPDHPFYDLMRDNMLAGIVQARRQGGGAQAAAVWQRFALPLPPGVDEAALAAIARRL